VSIEVSLSLIDDYNFVKFSKQLTFLRILKFLQV